jgi:hypothetical protein
MWSLKQMNADSDAVEGLTASSLGERHYNS